ncbi:hypothetical protein [Flavobacterium pedocola]
MKKLLFVITLTVALFSCENKMDKKPEQLTYDEFDSSTAIDTSGLHGNSTFSQINNSTTSVLPTGIDKVKLIPVYKIRRESDKNINYDQESSYLMEPEVDGVDFHYFMPGMDLLSGYNLINIAHYNLETEKITYFFSKPALIRNLYYPGDKQDSLNKLPIKRNYFLVSAYDEDTNKDSLINKKDLRKIYYIDEQNSRKIALLPRTHSAIRSSYDSKSDIMYIYARKDNNKNGKSEKEEPVNIFWINMQNPTVAKKML